jgi:hypothetical protein
MAVSGGLNGVHGQASDHLHRELVGFAPLERLARCAHLVHPCLLID